jgi:hypothetical protein
MLSIMRTARRQTIFTARSAFSLCSTGIKLSTINSFATAMYNITLAPFYYDLAIDRTLNY